MPIRAVTFPTILYTDVMDVYATDETSGARNVVVFVGIPCRLGEMTKADILAGYLRTEGTEFRILIYPTNVDLSSTYQIDVRGVRWSLQSGTNQIGRGPSGEIVYRTYQIARAL